MAYEVGPLELGGKTAERFDVVDYRLGDVSVVVGEFGIGVAVELRFEHLVGGEGVGISAMGVVEVLVAVELIGGLEGALFHLVEDVLHIDQAAAIEGEVETEAEHLLDEHRHIELVGIVAREVAIADELDDAWGKLLESGLVGHVGIADAVDGGSGFGNVYGVAGGIGGTDALHEGLFAGVGVDFVETDFYNMVGADLYAGGFEVEEDNGFSQFQLHCFAA